MNNPTFSSATELKAVIRLGWPMVLTQLFIMMNGFLDTAMAGRYNSLDLAGVSMGGNVFWPLFMLLTGINMALMPITSQLRGEQRISAIGVQVQQGLWLALLASIAMVIGCFHGGVVYTWFDVDPEAVAVATGYLRAMAWGVPAVIIYVALRNVCEGLGHTLPPMLITGTFLPLNAVLNFGFINGAWGFPELGGVGCGYATAIIFWLQLAAMLLVVRRPYFLATGLFERLHWPHWPTLLGIFKIGMPIGLSVFLEMTLFSVIGLAIASIGVIEMAAHSIAGNLNWMTYVIPMALGSAASIRVGFHVGARDFFAARGTSGAVYRFSLGYAIVVSVLLVTLRYLLVSVYTDDSAVVEIAVTLLLFIAVYQLVDDTQAVTLGALRGYKDTQVPMLFGLFGYWFLALPLGHALAREWIFPGLAPGVYGYWAGLTVGLTIVAILVGIRLWRTSKDETRILRLAGT
ncbi:MAG: MATE family efflux transporter [Pseudomonadota bacterium]